MNIYTAGEHFWVHYTSELIHPVGWSYITGHEIEATEEYKNEAMKMIETTSYPSNIAPPELFRQVINKKKRKKKNYLNEEKIFLGSNDITRR